MAVLMKTSSFLFLEKVGIAPILIEQLKTLDIKLALGFVDVKFTKADGTLLSEYKMSKTTDDLSKGKVIGTVLAAIQGGITAAITNAIQKMGAKPAENTAPVPPQVAVAPEGPTLTAAKNAGLKPLSEALSAPPIQKPSAGQIGVLMATEPVKLSEATMMYQPVKGSSSGSRYFVVAMIGDVKVAARISGSQVSLRVEGQIPADVMGALNKVGLDNKGSYMSGHFEGSEKVTPERVLGAVLLGSGLDFDTPMPALSKIKNKG